MIAHHLTAQQMHQAIKSIRRHLFEEAIRIPVVPDAIYNLTARLVFFQKLIQRLDVLLQIRVNGDSDIRMLPCCHHAGKNGALMPVIAGKTQAGKGRIRITQAVDELPGVIPASVIDEKDFALWRNLSLFHQPVQFFPHHLCAVRESLFLVVAGDDEIEGVGSVVVHFPDYLSVLMSRIKTTVSGQSPPRCLFYRNPAQPYSSSCSDLSVPPYA